MSFSGGLARQSAADRAIVLDSREWDAADEACAKRFSEDDRIEAQKLFANNKVFTSAAGCPNFEHICEYAYISDIPGVHMLAVYAGSTEIQAKALLKKQIPRRKLTQDV